MSTASKAAEQSGAFSTAVATVVVTYNRRHLLEKCLVSLSHQSRPVDRIFVIDNASTDDTASLVESKGYLDSKITYIRLDHNTGGAGGFSEGLRLACEDHFDWIWMMDDDAEPHQDALAQLLKIVESERDVYGSLAVSGNDTSWIMTLVNSENRGIELASDMPSRGSVQFLPFLGLMIHRQLVERIGLPDAGLFIAADDVEYCMRARLAGADLVIAGLSRIEHPKSDRYFVRLLGRRLVCVRLPPWKRYYDTRNRLLIARKYYGLRLLTETIPSLFVRLIATLWHEQRRLAQLWAFSAGMIDGLLGLKGRRHELWKIS